MVITRQGFLQVVGNSFAGFGFAPEGPAVYEFPDSMFLGGGDLTPINENIDKIVYGLTKWEPKFKEKGTFYASSDIKVQGANYQQAVDNSNNYYMSKEWADGLPIIPPTDERVKWILTGTDLPWDMQIGEKVLPRGGIATVHDIAVNLAMAGGRPEYLPVVIGMVDAITDPAYALSHVIPTTRNNWHGVIVHGKIGKEIRINSSYRTMGPHSLFPAQGPIGRCLSFVLQNFGGAIPGKGSMAIYGAMLYTNTVLAEDEDGVPPEWPTYGQERGFTRGANAVTVTPLESCVNTNCTGLSLTEDCLDRCIPTMPSRTSPPTNTDPDVKAGLFLMGRAFAAALRDKGYSKDDLRKYIWERIKITNNPSQLTIVIAGGDQSGHAYWLNYSNGQTKKTRPIQIPANWNALLAQAEKDLGPMPSRGG